MRRALVLSGGGAKGSWQVGACHHLIAERGLWFDVIAGVSAGAVNAATLAQAHDPDELATELEHLRSVWLGLRGSHDVYRRRWLGALGTVLARRASLYNAAPLRGVLAGHIDPARVAASPIRLRIGYVDLLSGRYRTAGNDHPTLVDAVLASCALPLIFPPVPLGDPDRVWSPWPAPDPGLAEIASIVDDRHRVAGASGGPAPGIARDGRRARRGVGARAPRGGADHTAAAAPLDVGGPPLHLGPDERPVPGAGGGARRRRHDGSARRRQAARAASPRAVARAQSRLRTRQGAGVVRRRTADSPPVGRGTRAAARARAAT